MSEQQFESVDGEKETKKEPAYIALPRWIPDDGVQMLLLYWLDHLDLTEHGGGVLGGWLTGSGYRLLEGLRRERALKDEFESLFRMHCIHGFDVEGPHRHECVPEPEETALAWCSRWATAFGVHAFDQQGLLLQDMVAEYETRVKQGNHA